MACAADPMCACRLGGVSDSRGGDRSAEGADRPPRQGAARGIWSRASGLGAQGLGAQGLGPRSSGLGSRGSGARSLPAGLVPGGAAAPARARAVRAGREAGGAEADRARDLQLPCALRRPRRPTT
eukprot:2671041-Rhodomonas_salina.1